MPALLINLGVNPFIEDEARRALVALEMGYSGNFVVPTLNGEYYYYKPPLYNWIIAAFYWVSGYSTEFISRLPTVIFTLLFGWTIYKVNRKYLSNMALAILSAFFFITCGRMLFWDSFLALIDICYSWTMYLMFIAIFHYWKSGNNQRLYYFSYALCAIGFLLKGFPSILFLGGGFLSILIIDRQWKKLLNWHHLIGVLIFVFWVGGYYWLYDFYNPIDKAVAGLLEQSTQRTIVRFNILDVLKHMAVWPFENIYHFLPWSILGILTLRKDIFQILRGNHYILYCTLCFFINILVYWVSPEVYPRYILMLLPLIFTIYAYLYGKEIGIKSWRTKSLGILLKIVVVVIPLAMIVGLWHPDVEGDTIMRIKIVFVTISLGIIVWNYFRFKLERPIILVCFVLMVRIGFDLVVLPIRANNDYAALAKSDAIEIGKKYKDANLKISKGTNLDLTSSFYLSSTRGQTNEIEYMDLKNQDKYFIIDPGKFPIPKNMNIVDSLRVREHRRWFYVID